VPAHVLTSALYEASARARGRLRRPHSSLRCESSSAATTEKRTAWTETAPAAGRRARPCSGSAGDWPQEELFGALYNLQSAVRLGVAVIGVASSA